MARKNKRARAGAKRARKAAKRKKRMAHRLSSSIAVDLDVHALDVTGPAPHDLPSLLDRCGLLKAALVEFTQIHPSSLRTARDLDADPRSFDWYLLHGRLRDGRPVLEAFCEETRGVTDADRTLLLSWSADAVGVFEPRHLADDHIVLHNLVDGLDYPARSNLGVSFLDVVPTDGWFFARLVPLLDGWLMSGDLTVFPPDTPRAEILCLAANIAKHHPEQVAKNPERRAAAEQMARDEAAFFERFFGGFETVIPGRKVRDVLTDYYSDWARTMPPQRNGYEAHGALEIPEELSRHKRVGVLFDEVWGLGMYPDYDVFREAFRDPERGRRAPFSETVLGYLESSGIDPLPFVIVGRSMPEQVSALLATLLRRPDFSWAVHGDALMREFKPKHFPPRPTITAIPQDQADALREHSTPLQPRSSDDGQRSFW